MNKITVTRTYQINCGFGYSLGRCGGTVSIKKFHRNTFGEFLAKSKKDGWKTFTAIRGGPRRYGACKNCVSNRNLREFLSERDYIIEDAELKIITRITLNTHCSLCSHPVKFCINTSVRDMRMRRRDYKFRATPVRLGCEGCFNTFSLCLTEAHLVYARKRGEKR